MNREHDRQLGLDLAERPHDVLEVALSSTLLGRWSVVAYERGASPWRATASDASIRSMNATSESIMMLPTMWTPAVMPSLRRFTSAPVDGVNKRSEMLSVTMRLISSSIVRSKLLSPASTCPTRTPCLVATSAQATVEVDVPERQHEIGPRLEERRLVADHDRAGLGAVIGRADVEEHVRVGMSRSAKKTSDMLAS